MTTEAMIKEQWINIDDSIVDYYPNFLSSTEATDLMSAIMKEKDTKFQQYVLPKYTTLTPRFEGAFTSDPTEDMSQYTHRQLHLFTPELQALKQRIEKFLTETMNEEVMFDYALCNIYMDGQHHVGFHSDKENMGTTIASISLGAERVFKMKKIKPRKYVLREKLLNGSMLVMAGRCQELYLHSLPKDATITQPRINITFRRKITTTTLQQ